MSRLLSPDDACTSVKVPDGHREATYNGRVIDVTAPSHIRVLKNAGYTVAAVGQGPARAPGFTCTSCGFASYFTTCSRCGCTCDRPDLTA